MINFWRYLKILFIALVFVGTRKNIIAQKIVFNHIGVENGLSQNSVLSIAQDSQGFIWYGTRFGLNRYDGLHFKIYKNKTGDSTSITNDQVLSLLQDSHGTLWVGTLHGLSRYDRLKDAFIKINLPAKNHTVVSINTIYEDKKGRIWFGSSIGLFQIINSPKPQINFFLTTQNGVGPGDQNVRSIYEDSENIFWIGTGNGLTKMCLVNGSYQLETFGHSEKDTNSLSNDVVTSIIEDKNNQLWIGTTNGLNLYQRDTKKFISFYHLNGAGRNEIVNNSIRIILADRVGKLWIGTQEGLSILDPVTKIFTSYQQSSANKRTLSQNSIHSLYEDENGSVYVGTYFGGINVAYLYSTAFTTRQSEENDASLSNNVVSGLVEDKKHNLWIGTEGGGLNYYNRLNNTFTIYKNKPTDANSLGSNLVKTVCRDKEGNIWIGTNGGGLNLFDAASNNFKRFFYKKNDLITSVTEISAILADDLNQIWIGTGHNLSVYKKNKGSLDPIPGILDTSASKLSVKALFEDSKKNIWVVSVEGLYKIKDGHAVCIQKNNVNCIAESQNGQILIGLYYGGLLMYNKEKKSFTLFTEIDGLPNNNVVGILEDDKKNFWVSTDNGLSRFNPETKSFKNYTSSDGLAGNSFNYNSFIKDSKGEFFFGGYNGLTSFFPDNIQTNNHLAPMVFTELLLFNEPVIIDSSKDLLKENISVAKKLTFNYSQNVFTIEFALLDFIKSNKHKYAYKLDGFDKIWNEVTIPSATYTNLPAGNYNLIIKGANNDGVWSKPFSLKIVVQPPFWKTWWAYCIYLLFFSGGILLVIRYFFLKALLKHEEALHQVKLNFFTNISHEIRTHLTLIMASINKLEHQNKQDVFIKQQLGNVKNNANRLLKLVSELMDFRKAETQNLHLQIAQFNIVDFLQEIYISFQELSLSKNITINFIYNTDNIPVYFDCEQLEKVFFNLLTNAFKFTQEGGRIILNIEQTPNTVIISIIDNGRGVDPEYQDKLFNNFFQVADYGHQNTGYGIGLALAKNIVELHKGSVAMESEPATKIKEGKTIFIVTLLKGNKHLPDAEYSMQFITTENDEKPAAELSLINIDPVVHSEKDFTILVVEDNAELRQLLEETFINSYNILLGENGLQGWDLATAEIPDLIISDVMMPKMNGFELCKKLKIDERTSHIPVILLTAKSSQADHVSGLGYGADVFLTKPFSTKVLELNVRNLLALREKMRQRLSSQLRELTEIKAVSGVTPIIENIELSHLNLVDKEFLEKAIALVNEFMENSEFGVNLLSKKLAMSRPILYKKLKAITNMSVNDFIKSLKLKKAAELLLEKDLIVYEVAYAVGYNDCKYFSKEFKKQFGKTPTEYINGEVGNENLES